ncbi:MAG: flagellar motor protein MotB [Pseudomonadota bacterium]|nr:flagellar motor protein MotB [Pseudomonadota bacterium]
MLFDDQETLEAEPKGTWLVTFADVIALLLAFFVMLFSMSNIKTETWDQIISGLTYSKNPKKDVAPRPQATKNVATVKLNQALSLEYLANVLEDH